MSEVDYRFRKKLVIGASTRAGGHVGSGAARVARRAGRIDARRARQCRGGRGRSGAEPQRDASTEHVRAPADCAPPPSARPPPACTLHTPTWTRSPMTTNSRAGSHRYVTLASVYILPNCPEITSSRLPRAGSVRATSRPAAEQLACRNDLGGSPRRAVSPRFPSDFVSDFSE